MKIVNDYDLIEKINKSKGKIDLLKIILRSMAWVAPVCGLNHLFNLSIDFFKYIAVDPLKFLLIHYFITVTTAVLSKIYVDKSRKCVISFNNDLLKLLNKLRESGIKTDLELLNDSKEDLVEYKFINEDARLRLRENKYILIPTNDGFGGVKDVSVLQEHNIGSKVYVLSLGSPKKCAKPVRVYN